ncbi:hypothetical protein C5469_01650 [Photorhabdus cinerea]|uniref:Uncharacterized protein n=1 Tax=Photorhabdus cinerea TaxID=471575 RepID=A0A7X5QAV2_9GAMM|nr:hypothetical protein [Photorhabdus cinerea]
MGFPPGSVCKLIIGNYFHFYFSKTNRLSAIIVAELINITPETDVSNVSTKFSLTIWQPEGKLNVNDYA